MEAATHFGKSKTTMWPANFTNFDKPMRKTIVATQGRPVYSLKL